MSEPEPTPKAAPDMSTNLRRATPADADAVADVYLASLRATYDFPLAHSDDETRAWIREHLIPRAEVWVAVGSEGSGSVVGFMALDGSELDQLYIAPGWWGRGIGGRFVELAMRLRPEGLALHTFQVNARARRFYERRGFEIVDLNDGSRNEERQPDVQYAWRPSNAALSAADELPPSQLVSSARAPTWDGAYAGTPPWDIGRPQPAFLRLAAAGLVTGHVLDVGCGTGEHALMATGMGFDATGIDASGVAIGRARQKADARGLDTRFLVWDALELPALGERWDTVLDCGLFHVFDDAERVRFVASLRAVVAPGGRYHMLVFSDRQAGTLGPRRVTEAEIRAAFVDGWRVESIEAAVLETNPWSGAPGMDIGEMVPGSDPRQHGAQAWLATVTRV